MSSPASTSAPFFMSNPSVQTIDVLVHPAGMFTSFALTVIPGSINPVVADSPCCSVPASSVLCVDDAKSNDVPSAGSDTFSIVT